MICLAYFLKVNLTLLLCLALYRTFFKGLTFFRWNRFFLLASVVLSFLLPLLKLQWSIPLVAVADIHGIDWLYVDHLTNISAGESSSFSGPSTGYILLALYLLVTLIFLGTSMQRFSILYGITRHARQISDGRIKVFMQDKYVGSFTFFRHVYLDRHTYENRSRHVIAHEMVHATQLHSIDLLIMELVSVFLWFNPLVFLLKRYIRDNHEYLADDHARENQDSIMDYLACLRAEAIRQYSPAIASYFKSPTIKNRIIMLTSHHSKKLHKLRYLVAIPVIALLTIAFQAPAEPVILKASAETFLSRPPDGIPSLFPLPDKHRENVTWGYDQKAIHPFTKKETSHLGVDIKAPKGTKVFATADGVVLRAGNYEGWGNMVVLQHGNEFETFYAHLDSYSVEAGKKVVKGEVIGGVGNTGQSTGPHLHFEVRKAGEHVNPSDYY